MREECSDSRLCRRESSTFASTMMDVTNAWHRGWRERIATLGGGIYIREKLFEYEVEGENRGWLERITQEIHETWEGLGRGYDGGQRC